MGINVIGVHHWILPKCKCKCLGPCLSDKSILVRSVENLCKFIFLVLLEVLWKIYLQNGSNCSALSKGLTVWHSTAIRQDGSSIAKTHDGNACFNMVPCRYGAGSLMPSTLFEQAMVIGHN